MKQTNDNDFAQFQGGYDCSHALDPSFVTSLRQQMVVERTAAQELQTAESVPHLSVPRQVQKPVPRSPQSLRPVWAAVAALLVIAVATASIWQLGDLVNEGQYAGAPQVVLPADAEVTPGPDVELSPELLATTNAPYESYMVLGDVIIGNGRTTPGEGMPDGIHVYALDAQSGDQLWNHQAWYVYSSIADGDSIYMLKETEDYRPDGIQEDTETNGLEPEPENAPTERDTHVVDGISLIALDPRSGAEKWEYELPAYETDSHAFWSKPIVVDDVIYLATWDIVVAVDAASGVELWQSPTELPDSGADKVVSLTMYEGHVVLAGNGGHVVAIDGATGEINASHQINLSRYLDRYSLPDVRAHDDGVVAVWRGGGGSKSVTMLIDPLEGNVLTTVVTGSSPVSASHADDGSFAFVVNKWHAGNIFLQILGRGNYTTYSLVWVDAVDGSVRLSTEDTRVEDRAPMPVANDGKYACFMSTSFDCFNAAGTRFTVTDDTVYWAQISEGKLYYSVEGGVFVVDLP